MASSACRQFDIVGHIDLVKIWGHRPRRKSVLAYLDPVLKSIKYHGLAVEINSGGLRKPVGELYPSSAIVERMYDYDIPVTLGSDAHHPEQIGSGLIEAYRCARRAGYQRCVTFSRRVMTVVPCSIKRRSIGNINESCRFVDHKSGNYPHWGGAVR